MMPVCIAQCSELPYHLSIIKPFRLIKDSAVIELATNMARYGNSDSVRKSSNNVDSMEYNQNASCLSKDKYVIEFG